MESEHHQSKHTCKFCSKMFPCGRSLGGHMRSHLINNTSPSDHQNNDHKNLPKKKKKLPHLAKSEFDIGFSFESPNKSFKSPKKGEEYTSLVDKICKQCGKSFQSWKALFGHMKCHSVNSSKPVEEEDSWDTSINQSDDAANPSRGTKKQRSKVTKTLLINTNTSNSSPLNVANLSPCVSEMIDHQQEEDEVAMSLILLSRDVGTNWEKPTFENLKVDKKRANKRKKHIDPNYFDSEKQSKLFSCIVCKKDFPSYQALGGHRASHKKFKSCCFAPEAENRTKEIEKSLNEDYGNKSKDHIHECSICFRVFSSGQALGGHKRSHLIADQSRISSDVPSSVISVQKPIEEIRVCGFFDLNLPAPDEEEEECSDFKNCWIGDEKNEVLLGLLSTS